MDTLEKIFSTDIDEKEFKDYLFYDIEVFKYDSLVVFKNYQKETVAYFWNGEFDKIDKVIKDKILVGFNNYSYDDYILTAMRLNYSQEQLKDMNDSIIESTMTFYNPIKVPKDFISLDCRQQMTPGGKKAQPSLKRIEGNLGKSIVETGVDFNIDRPLTDVEKNITLKYCKYDVESTIDIFKLRFKSYFIPKFNVIKMMDREIRNKAVKWNTTTIAANFVTNHKIKSYFNHSLIPHEYEEDETNYSSDYLSDYELYRKVPKRVVDVWDKKICIGDKVKENYTHEDMDCIFEFGFGGLHAVNKKKNRFRNVYLLDVTSMYPNILVYLTALGDKATKRFSRILKERIAIKHTDPIKANAYKLILNSVYGQMKNRYSKVYNPAGAESVCIYGQIALYDLCSKLYKAGYTLINANTDGIAFTGYSNHEDIDYNTIVREWEEEFKLKLELSRFKRWIQKDVNNYIAIDYDNKVKVKGGDVNAYHDPKDFDNIDEISYPGIRWSSNNSIGIVDHCLVNKILYDKEPYETVIENENNPLLFQMILHTGTKYKESVDILTGEKYQKVNRIFAAKNNVNAAHLVKQRVIDGRICTCAYPNAPENMYVYNGDLSYFDNFTDVVDFGYYINLANKLISRW